MYSTRSRYTCLLAGLALSTLLSSAAEAQGVVTKIEEDWEVHLNDPEVFDGTPELVHIISPREELWGTHFYLELNHNSQPEFSAGGLQLQRWLGNYVLDYKTLGGKGRLNSSNEVIKYTITMWVTPDNNKVHVEVSGTSSHPAGGDTSWGQFGGNGDLKLSGYTVLEDLAGYCRHCSTENTSVTVAAHNIKKFVNTEVRYYNEDTLLSTDSEDQVLHTYQDYVTETDE